MKIHFEVPLYMYTCYLCDLCDCAICAIVVELKSSEKDSNFLTKSFNLSVLQPTHEDYFYESKISFKT